MKKFMEEFKAFALRGNVMDMAIGVIIGGAFSGIVTSLTDNFITPILNVLTGGARYGMADISGFASNFLGAVVNFIIMAFILFCLMKGINKLLTLNKKEEEPKEPTTKVCGESVLLSCKSRCRAGKRGIEQIMLCGYCLLFFFDF